MCVLITDSAFKQQKLPAWQPILTAGTVLPTFFVIGIAFIPVGIGLLYFSDEVNEVVIDYTNCNRTELKNLQNYSYTETTQTCIEFLNENKNNTNREDCICRIEFELKENFEVSVLKSFDFVYFESLF